MRIDEIVFPNPEKVRGVCWASTPKRMVDIRIVQAAIFFAFKGIDFQLATLDHEGNLGLLSGCYLAATTAPRRKTYEGYSRDA
jgi:hypothetical protein